MSAVKTVFPVDLGQEVWIVDEYDKHSTSATVEKLIYKNNKCYMKLSCNSMYETSCASIGKTVFLTCAEAEERVRYLKGN